MKLSLWTYEGPTHVGAMRVVTSMENAHFVLHAPQGDTYADLLFTMIERQDKRPPVTYTTFQARDLGSDTANLFVESVNDTVARFKPDVLFVGESCTAELIQDQPGSLTLGMNLDIPVVPLELPAYSRKENFGASETFYAVVRRVLSGREKSAGTERSKDDRQRPSVNLLGATSLGFRCRDDIPEVIKLVESLGMEVNVVAPLGASLEDISRIPEADLNVCLYPEVARTCCDWLKRQFGMPYTSVVPIGVGACKDFLVELCTLVDELNARDRTTGDSSGADTKNTSFNVEKALNHSASRLPWYSRSIDSNYLTGKRVFIFGDATHVVAAARVASEELGFEVVGIGTYSRECARDVRDVAKQHNLTALITDDYLEVEDAVKAVQPELILGTQMERHLAKRLGIGCCVISAPFHVEDCPARYAPQMGLEGANVIFDTWVHPLMMGLEEHLLGMFREDFEFNDTNAPSHLGSHAQMSGVEPEQARQFESAYETSRVSNVVLENELSDKPQQDIAPADISWTAEAEQELRKIPFFVRAKARRNTERYASDFDQPTITIETLYDAKAHFSQ